MFKAIIEFLTGLFHSDPPNMEKPSPGNWLPPEAITYDQITGLLTVDLNPIRERLGLSMNPVYQPNFIPDSNSMDPIFDTEHNLILIAGAVLEDHAKLIDALKAGDDAVYWDGSRTPAHRILNIEQDAQGKKFTFEGVNNAGIPDPYIIRPEHIRFISVGIIF